MMMMMLVERRVRCWKCWDLLLFFCTEMFEFVFPINSSTPYESHVMMSWFWAVVKCEMEFWDFESLYWSDWDEVISSLTRDHDKLPVKFIFYFNALNNSIPDKFCAHKNKHSRTSSGCTKAKQIMKSHKNIKITLKTLKYSSPFCETKAQRAAAKRLVKCQMCMRTIESRESFCCEYG